MVSREPAHPPRFFVQVRRGKRHDDRWWWWWIRSEVLTLDGRWQVRTYGHGSAPTMPAAVARGLSELSRMASGR